MIALLSAGCKLHIGGDESRQFPSVQIVGWLTVKIFRDGNPMPEIDRGEFARVINERSELVLSMA